jgi:lysophospholipase L1-like esterase
MRTVKWALTALGLFCLPVAPAGAAAYVLGDSLGLGISQAAKLKNLSKLSVHIRGPKAVHQFAHIPAGSTVFLSLGTNDAHGSIARLDKSIDAIVRAAERKNAKVFWMGPPCIRRTWDSRARELDAILHAKLANTSIHYVSMRDDLMCSGALHAGDGVHLKMKGYAHMWEKARLAAGYAVADANLSSAVVAVLPRPAVRAKKIERIPLPIPRRPRP